MAAYKALTEQATLVLSDKLVPSEVLDLIPKSTPLYIAKKFPGNAEGAQNELMEMAVEAARRGEVVVRLKQGDPFLYGRGGEEVIHFRSQPLHVPPPEPLSSTTSDPNNTIKKVDHIPTLVIPGLSSSLCGPTLASIPVTNRGVAESIVICTGVGRGGKTVEMPGYERGRSLVILMGVARLASLVATLIHDSAKDSIRTTEGATNEGEVKKTSLRSGSPYPPYTPIAIVERASCADQRVILSTLEHIVNVLERSGEARVPGMIVIGWSVLALAENGAGVGGGCAGSGTVLDDASACAKLALEKGLKDSGKTMLEESDRARVQKWLGGERGVVREGLDEMWNLFL
jgi:uroporphyrin-III C-methyltransferase